MNNNLFELGAAAVKRAAQRSGGRYAWCAASITRWKKFCGFCESIGVNSTMDVNYEVLVLYADSISNCATSTKQNSISTLNVVMNLLDLHWKPVSPRKLIGEKRSFVNNKPALIDRLLVEKITSRLTETNHPLLADVVNLAFYFGLRRREAALLELKKCVT